MATAKPPALDPKALLAELKANRRTQVALAAFVLVLVWIFWPDAPRVRRSSTTAANAYLDPKALGALRALPDLAALDQAGELPALPKLMRDPFLFEAPVPPKPPEKVKPLPPPPEKTPQEVAEEQRQAAIAAENASRPQDFRYLGFLKGTPAGQVGAFMKGEEAHPLTLGTLLRERWKLVELTDRKAVFQNTRFQDLRFELATRDTAGGPAAGAATNEF